MSEPIVIAPEPKIPWTRNQFIAELRRAGWTKMQGSPASAYVSPDDSTVYFDLDRYRRHLGGVCWIYFAERHELPSTTQSPF